jgi:hypothetical protein
MSERGRVLRRVLANPRLRRVELAFLAFGAAEYGVWVAVLVYAYQRGGAGMSAAIAVIQLVPAAVVAPFGARLAEHRGAAVALRLGYFVQVLSIGACATAMLLDAPSPVAYAGAIVAASAVTLTRPAQGALLPSLVDSPAELTAANVVSGWVESVSLLVGPALAGAVIALAGPGAALAAFAGAVLGSAVLVAPLYGPGGDGAEADEATLADVTSVVMLVRTQRGVAAVLALGAVQFVAMGAQDVLEVVLALKVLGLGASGAGYLAAAFGGGAIAGGIGSLSLIGRHRLVGPLLAAGIGWGAAFVALGAWPTAVGAFVLLAAAGASHTVLDASSRTMLHRVVPSQLHGRVFGVLEGLAMLGLAIGSLSVPAMMGLGGAQAALIAVGAVLLVVPLSTVATLLALERAAPTLDLEVSLLRGSPLFAMLAAPVLEDLARALVREHARDGDAIVREREVGDRFYLLAEGELDVSIDGAHVRTLTPGEGFGEIALLRDGVRTATVVARGPATLYALERAPFLEAVTGSYQASQAAEKIVADRLATENPTAAAT